MEETKDELTIRCNTLTSELKTSKDEREKQIQINQQLLNKNETLNQSLTEKTNLLSDATKQIDRYNLEVEQLKGKMRENQNLIQQSQLVNEQLTNQINRLSNDHATVVENLKTSLSDVKRNLQSRTEELISVRTLLQSTIDSKTNLLNEREVELNSKLLLSCNQVTQLQTDLEMAQLEIENKSKDIESLNVSLSSLHDEVSQLKQELTTVKSEYIKMSGSSQNKQSEIEHILDMEYSLLESTIFFTNSMNCVQINEPGISHVSDKMPILLKELLTYLNGTDYRFLNKVIKVIHQVVTITDVTETWFWFRQVIYLSDALCKQLPKLPADVKHSIGNDGIKVSLKDHDNAEFGTRFVSQFHHLVLFIYNQLVDVVAKDLGALLITIAFQNIDDSGQPAARKAPQTPTSKSTTLARKGTAPRNQPTVNKAKPAQTTYNISEVLQVFSELLITMEKAGIVHSVMMQYLNQIYCNLDCVLFNELLQNASIYCVCERGIYLKLAISEMETWASNTFSSIEKKYGKLPNFKLTSLGKLQYSSEAANVLVLEKSMFTDLKMMNDIFPNLSLSQLYRLLNRFKVSVPPQLFKEIESRPEYKGSWSATAKLIDFVNKCQK